jgi:hypothetical protein
MANEKTPGGPMPKPGGSQQKPNAPGAGGQTAPAKDFKGGGGKK